MNDAAFVAQVIASYSPQNFNELAPHRMLKTFKDFFRGMDGPLVTVLPLVQYAATQQGIGMISFLEQHGSLSAERCAQVFTALFYERIWLLGQVAGPIPTPVIKLINDFAEFDLTANFAKAAANLIRMAPVLSALETKGLHWTQISP